MKVYHGSKNFHKELKLGGGNNEVGSGLYFIADIKVAKNYGNNIVAINTDDFSITKFNTKTPSRMVDELIKNSNDEYWWSNWNDNYIMAVKEFKKTLLNEFGEDIQTLWYELYKNDEENFCNIVSKYTDGMYVNQENGFKDMFIMYNIPKVNELMEYMKIKESRFDSAYIRYITETKIAHVPDDVRKANVKRNLEIAKERNIRTDGEFMLLFHGTSNANMKKIHKTNRFNNGTWFGADIETAELYAKRNHGDKSSIDSVFVWAGVLSPSGKYWVSNEELYFKNSRYMPKDMK